MEVLADQVTEATLSIVVIRADGTIEDYGDVSHYKRPAWRKVRDLARRLVMATVITNAGQAVPSGRMIGATPSQAEPKYLGWGTGAGTAAAADTTLFSEKALDLAATTGTRVTGTSSQITTTQTNDTYQLTGTMTATGAGSVTNLGCFDNATIASGALYVKGDFTSIGLASGDSIVPTIKVKFS